MSGLAGLGQLPQLTPLQVAFCQNDANRMAQHYQQITAAALAGMAVAQEARATSQASGTAEVTGPLAVAEAAAAPEPSTSETTAAQQPTQTSEGESKTQKKRRCSKCFTSFSPF